MPAFPIENKFINSVAEETENIAKNVENSLDNRTPDAWDYILNNKGREFFDDWSCREWNGNLLSIVQSREPTFVERWLDFDGDCNTDIEFKIGESWYGFPGWLLWAMILLFIFSCCGGSIFCCCRK